MKCIDLRSDTVTQPTAAMRQAMASATVGDDVYGEDPTINQLEAAAAARVGMEAGLFVPSGTQGNLLGIMSHCERGDEYIVGQSAHSYLWEGGGAAVLGSVQPQPLEVSPAGILDLEHIQQAIKPDNFHFARTRLICLENTFAGRVLPLAYLEEVAQLASDHSLSLHLDGARLFNAAVKLGVPATEITRHFHSVCFCLSKGLGAPVGSVLCGSQEFIQRARRWRKVLGGGMRQAGILAAAGLYALEHHVQRLAEDHLHALILAKGLAELKPVRVDLREVDTNMVFMTVEANSVAGLRAFLQEQGILISQRPRIRLVTHLDIGREDIDRVLESIQAYYAPARI